MFGIINYAAFLISGVLLNITPGADTLFILGQSVSKGKKAGLLSALGISTGALVHMFLAAFGLAYILSESQMAFTIIKYIGAAYLIGIGLRSLGKKGETATPGEADKVVPSSLKNVYLSGMFTNLFNPKVALFFLAFLPQFIDSNYRNSTLSLFGAWDHISGHRNGMEPAIGMVRFSILGPSSKDTQIQGLVEQVHRPYMDRIGHAIGLIEKMTWPFTC